VTANKTENDGDTSGKQTTKKQTTKKATRKRSPRADERTRGDRQDDEQRKQGEDGRHDDKRSSLKPMQAARLAIQQIRQLTGRTVDGVSAVDREGDGWHVLVEVVEVERVPAATDVIGVYAAILDSDGDLESYERVRRYVRAQAGDDS